MKVKPERDHLEWCKSMNVSSFFFFKFMPPKYLRTFPLYGACHVTAESRLELSLAFGLPVARFDLA